MPQIPHSFVEHCCNRCEWSMKESESPFKIQRTEHNPVTFTGEYDELPLCPECGKGRVVPNTVFVFEEVSHEEFERRVREIYG